MPKIINPFSVRNNYEVCNNSLIHKFIFFSLIIFVISLPFNGIETEWSLIKRFEIKPTMVSFSLLFVAWLLSNLNFHTKRTLKEKVFWFIGFLYVASQFTSLINSPFPADSIKQGIIIASLVTMMVVTSETILDNKTAERVLYAICAVSLIIGIMGTLNYYLLIGYSGRLGQRISGLVQSPLGIIDIGGDPQYLGDIFLYSAGAVLFVSLKLYKRKHCKYFIWPCLMLWYSAIILTFVKALILSIFCFLIISCILMKGKRFFVVLNFVLFALVLVGNYHLIKSIAFEKSKEKLIKEVLNGKVTIKSESIQLLVSKLKNTKKNTDEKVREIRRLKQELLEHAESITETRMMSIVIDEINKLVGKHREGEKTSKSILIDLKKKMKEIVDISKNKVLADKYIKDVERSVNNIVKYIGIEGNLQDAITSKIMDLPESIRIKLLANGAKARMQTLLRLNVFDKLGSNSLSIRAKASLVSFFASLNAKWFGHGAGLSQTLLPEIANQFDRMMDEQTNKSMQRLGIYGESANRSLIDSHIFLLTEFFNVGLAGLIPLMALLVFVIVQQVKTMKVSIGKNEKMNELLFATLVSMLIYRLAGSFVVIPFLWFMLGLSFGVCKLYWHNGVKQVNPIVA